MTSPASDELIRVYFEKRANLVRFFAARTGSMAMAEDLVQDLYVKLRGLSEIDAVANPTALLYKIASNLMLDSARGSQRQAQRDNDWREASRGGSEGEGAQLPPADEVLASRQRLTQLVAAVDELPPQMGRAFRLHKLQGLSHAQTAQAMGISVKVVEKHISAALRRLADRIGG